MPVPLHAPFSDLLDLPFAALERRLAAEGVRPAHALPLWRALYRDPAGPRLDRPELPPPLRRWLAARGEIGPVPLPSSRETVSGDGLTRKFLVALADGREVETVAMGYDRRHTLCLSTQAGCALGCVFCATGQAGFARHLRAREIVAQILLARRRLVALGHPPPRNLVLMGMGEPLHNYDAVMQALDIACDRRGLNLAPAHVSLSTVGLVPGILRLAAEGRPYHLAVSLHAATDAERSALLPVNRKWPLAELLAACREYQTITGRRILFSWTLIAGRNDTPAHARQVVDLLRGLDAHVNLIPLNPTGRYDGQTPGEPVGMAFQRVIRAAGLPCTFRQRRGIDVDAGCGQLASPASARRPAPAALAALGP
jgi:23S rRNA (adenine2503-C2)-methyltransferase